MPKKFQSESCLHDWVHRISFQQQALLLTAMRGPDGSEKNNTTKIIIRYIRGVVIKPAGDWDGTNDNDFMWGEYENARFITAANMFWKDHDHYPHHFIMHLFHCAGIIGYKHPGSIIRAGWHWFYIAGCKAFHLRPESEHDMDQRLNDFGCGWHNEE